MTWRFQAGPGHTLAQLHAGLEQGLDAGLEYLRGESMKQVPVDEGTLMRSATVSREGLSGAVSYDTVYAARQHEETEWQHPNGRKAKYLEDPMTQDRQGILRAIAEASKWED